MSKKRETRRQLRIRKTLQKEVGGYWRKIWGGVFQQGGIADLLGCVEGLFFAFEVKEPGGTPSELQLDEIDEVLEAGGIAAIVIEPDEAVQLVRDALVKAKNNRRQDNSAERVRVSLERAGYGENNHHPSRTRKTKSIARPDSDTLDKHRSDVGSKTTRTMDSSPRTKQRKRCLRRRI